MTTPPRAPARSALDWRFRLQTHVAVAVTLVVGLALGAAMIIATRVVTSGSLDRAGTALGAARSAFYRLQDDRGFLIHLPRQLAQDPGFGVDALGRRYRRSDSGLSLKDGVRTQ